MQKTIISDTSCLILLDKIEELILLKLLFGEIIVTTTIAEEFGKSLPDWIKIQDAKNKNYLSILLASIDRGEASAISLALEQEDCLLLLDDLKARKLANELKLKYTGTLGVFLDAKLRGHIATIKPILEKVKQTNFYLPLGLEKKLLDLAGE